MNLKKPPPGSSQVPPISDPTSALELYLKNQNTSALDIYFPYNSSELLGSEFWGTWEDPGGGFIKFAVKTTSKQD